MTELQRTLAGWEQEVFTHLTPLLGIKKRAHDFCVSIGWMRFEKDTAGEIEVTFTEVDYLEGEEVITGTYVRGIPSEMATTPAMLSASIALDLLLEAPFGRHIDSFTTRHFSKGRSLQEELALLLENNLGIRLPVSSYEEAATTILLATSSDEWPDLPRSVYRELLCRKVLDARLRVQVALLAGEKTAAVEHTAPSEKRTKTGRRRSL